MRTSTIGTAAISAASGSLKFNCTGINYQIRRELADMTDLPCPGPGGPVNEAPLHVDSFGLLS